MKKTKVFKIPKGYSIESIKIKNPTYYETIVKSDIWKEWTKYAEDKLLFDMSESIECGWLSDKHWEAFIDWIEETTTRVVMEYVILQDKSKMKKCGREYEPREHQAKFCSRDCYKEGVKNGWRYNGYKFNRIKKDEK